MTHKKIVFKSPQNNSHNDFIIPQGLANLANGRDNITTEELAQVTNYSIATILKDHCLYGHFKGVKPIKIGKKLNFPVIDVAKLLVKGQI